MSRRQINIVQPSTRAFMREARKTPGYRLFDFLHGYVYARWPYLYISIGKGEHPLSPTLAKISGAFNRFFLSLLNPNGTEDKSGGITFAETYHGWSSLWKLRNSWFQFRKKFAWKTWSRLSPTEKPAISYSPTRDTLSLLNVRAAQRKTTHASLWMSA